MTRTNDVDVPLPDRVQAAERAKADVFISLHFNSGLPNKELAGIETYCLTPAGLPSNLVRTYEDDPKALFPNNAYDEQNFQVAYKLHRSLMETSGAPDRGLRRARFMSVLRGQNRPAVLIEGGYLSIPMREKRLPQRPIGRAWPKRWREDWIKDSRKGNAWAGQNISW